MSGVDEVKSWMSFYGWDNGGAPGSVKRDADGQVIARHGYEEWSADVEKAIEAVKRERERWERERQSP
jgi:acyl-CoA reductase-like NAD-dependent aldehyde dehydrogenase